jgi:hypothetical protein
MDGQRRVRRDAVIQAYQDLRQAEREEVDYLAGELDLRMAHRTPHVHFSHSMAVELLGCIGIHLCHLDEAKRAVSHGPQRVAAH